MKYAVFTINRHVDENDETGTESGKNVDNTRNAFSTLMEGQSIPKKPSKLMRNAEKFNGWFTKYVISMKDPFTFYSCNEYVPLG